MDFDHPPSDPIAQLRVWLEDAKALELPNPNAMTLTTVDPDGRPSARIVLLKGLDVSGAVFFTNYRSRKGRAIDAHRDVTMVIHWDPLQRQVVMEGSATRTDDRTSDEYFASRPRGSQISAWASQQSTPVASRAELDAAYAAIEAKFDGQPVPRPPHWGGFRVTLRSIVFWEACLWRLHDRVCYTANDAGHWHPERLYP